MCSLVKSLLLPPSPPPPRFPCSPWKCQYYSQKAITFPTLFHLSLILPIITLTETWPPSLTEPVLVPPPSESSRPKQLTIYLALLLMAGDQERNQRPEYYLLFTLIWGYLQNIRPGKSPFTYMMLQALTGSMLLFISHLHRTHTHTHSDVVL